ncbi:putative Gamma-interferon-inducible lysosomal thiol reductase [Hypsibius exemplaris]|uniref:Gamma-interferon-inducible lysosomal thiol reductase n=1 Tax=Hypsibius exemplaris TaxID=2072580 RepID=A0A1W0WD37_HYPEX|nr:putative Gamma-interferon-inducible lysosomal thiol reductase [Hypsibius exemplaris]
MTKVHTDAFIDRADFVHFMASHRRQNSPHPLKFWKATGRPRYLLEVFSLLLAISILFLAYRYYFGSLADVFDEKLCAKPVTELCLLEQQVIDACRVSANCEALSQQKKDAAAAKQTDTPLVLVEVFYEVLCRDSKEFIIEQVFPAFQKVGGIVNMSLVPYGKATERQDGNEYVFTCQHGPNECKGNIIQTCAISLCEGKDRNLALSFVNCMMVSHDSAGAGPSCAKDVGVEWAPIETCSTSSAGNKLQHIMAQRTDSLKPKLNWVPWVVVNGVHTQDIQDQATNDLRKLICDTYKGPRSPGCDS